MKKKIESRNLVSGRAAIRTARAWTVGGLKRLRKPMPPGPEQQSFEVRYKCPALLLFFFQAEDGIRSATVTGVQTCALPILPQTYKTGIRTIITGVDPRTGASFTDHSAEVYAGWCNASKGMDAWGALNASFGNLWKATAEINESLYPHVQWSRDYRTDSGGPGQWRGICGSHYEKEVRVDAKVYTYVVGMKYPMPGICGGRDGSPNEMILRYGSDDPFRVEHTANNVPVAAGQRIMYDYGGGGGWGNPLDREPQAVLDDVLDEYVSVEGARRDYGVVLTGSLEELTLAIDDAATTNL